MKVFAYVGSPRGEKSLGVQFIQMVKEKIESMDNSIEFNIFRDDQLNIKEHTGSIMDFNNGQSLYNDDMKIIEEEMLSSDFIILISPVYAHNVSSQMKKFIDRISYWLHLFKLSGKFGYAVSIADNNGIDYVSDYLKKVMQYMGIYVLGTTGIQGNKLASDVNTLQSYANHLAKKILISETIEEIDTEYEQESFFKNQKNMYLKSDTKSKEKDFWEKNGYFEFNTFEELFISKLKQFKGNKIK
ncbi:flavodoxin family protein (plasmid) [Clostridium perfringens]|uniref:4Fe-4S ferredoxin-domain protein (NADPH-dependent FMN reductase family) n=1 Tax=Clostridium perfringens TaxID=1502 RepID=A0A2X2Y5Q4_CLOPF|nr:flavodoxin family protein [Clostridium perfringens]NGT74028.1 flavodoxin family protein [Clostridium perfringens]SQB59474.1 4Fe-4S ferredoxin-domain protein (NADPH-dependent FMN reductase family) [Clostridium perfringens]